MRQEPNKEIDLLLRQLSRRNGVPVSEPDEQHLDADELNSYVANALPSAARARYTEHLADCSSCRKLVAQLSAAEGPVVVKEPASAVAPSGLRSFLASLFSPMVLRYAAPAIGLMVIVAVGVIVSRRESPKSTSVALLENTDQTRSVLPSPSPAETSPAETTTATKTDGPATKKEAAPQQELQARAAKEAPVAAAPPAAEPVTSDEAPPPAPKVSASTDFNAQRAEESKRAEELKKEKQAAADSTAAAPSSADRAANQPVKQEYRRTDEIVATPGAVTGTASPMRRQKQSIVAGAGQSTSRSEGAKDGDFSSGETRSVAGRRFRKSSGVWIDTAYDASKGTTNVARGSEQYRALVADEPSIRTIAEQLDGQIIVVWKGRAYRIR